jgi:hypothetical protein
MFSDSEQASPRTQLAFLGHEFDAFLFASVGEDCNGMSLSVASALARQDLDPWREAANLAGLPRETATRRLAALIASLPDRPPADSEPGAIAARLVAFLPKITSSLSSRLRLPKTSNAVKSPPARRALVWLAASVVVLGLSIMASHDLSSTSGGARAPESTAASADQPKPQPQFGR